MLPERNESGTITGLCYVELASETDARKAPQVLKDGVVINGRKVKVAFLPLAELDVCSRNLERLRGVVGGGIPASSTVPSSGNDTPMSPEQSRHSNMSNVMEIPTFHDNSRAPGTNGLYDQSMMNRASGVRPVGLPQRVFITGLPPSAMERDIGDFFSDVGVIPKLVICFYNVTNKNKNVNYVLLNVFSFFMVFFRSRLFMTTTGFLLAMRWYNSEVLKKLSEHWTRTVDLWEVTLSP